MTLLTICQGAANAARVQAPAFIVGNQDQTAVLLLQLANDEGEALARRKSGGWAAMVTQFIFETFSFQVVGTVTSGSSVITGIAPNTTGLVNNIFQASGTGIPNNAIISAFTTNTATWSGAVPGTQTSAGQTITFGQSDYALPSDYQRPVDGTFWDRSRFWQMRGALSPQQWQLYKSSIFGAAVTVQRRYRIRNVAGTLYLSIDPVPTDNGSPLVWEYVSNAWCESNVGVRQTQWVADTDIGIVDEFLIRKGVTWRLLERLGMSYGEAQDEYEQQCDMAVAHDAGTQVIDMVRFNQFQLGGPWNVVDGNFPG